MSRKKKDEYEQLELDTRKALDVAIDLVANEAVHKAQELTVRCKDSTTHTQVRNRHEAYGIAAEHFAKTNKAVFSIKADISKLLGTLADVNLPAIEAVSDICNSTGEAVSVLVKAAAEMKRTLADLYAAETHPDEPTPMEEMMAGPEYEEAEPAEGEGSQDPEESGEHKEE